jgi:peptidoglycan biosynthesis protein MviN/MurJ (putative lipid II flippase)
LAETLIVALSLVLNALLPYLIVRRDLARLSEERLARAWTPASFLSAVYAFGPLSLPVHFAKTRRSLLGFALGIGWLVLAVLAEAAVTAALGALLGVD